jgi:type I restriction enzyme M protein
LTPSRLTLSHGPSPTGSRPKSNVRRLLEIDLQLTALNGATGKPAKKSALQSEQQALKASQQAHEEASKIAQREGDSIYWPIYNLDLKNPNGKETLEHVPPMELVAAMLTKEKEAAALLAEIAALVEDGE